MNLWAVQITRKSHSKEVLNAKIVDADTMNVTEMGGDLLYLALTEGGIFVNNLGIQGNRVVLTGYDRTLREHGAKMYMKRVSRNGRLTESFIIVLRGYKAVYEFLLDNPINTKKAINMIGTVDDLYYLLKESDIQWDGFGLYNGIVTKNTWANEKYGRNKILKYVEELPSKHDWFCDHEIHDIADLRLAIDCEYCQLRLVDGAPVIVNIKFNNKEVKIPEGIFAFNKSFGGAYMVTFPESLIKLGNNCLKLDNDVLQVNFSAPIQNIPELFAASSELQIFNYPERFGLECIDEYAFYCCYNLRSDLISQVLYIKKCAFEGTAIKKVIIPNCKEIGTGAFRDCTKLETVKLGNNVVIHDFAFDGCTGLKHVDLSGAISIGNGAFKDCKRLKDVVVRRSARIGYDAFHKNTSIHWV